MGGPSLSTHCEQTGHGHKLLPLSSTAFAGNSSPSSQSFVTVSSSRSLWVSKSLARALGSAQKFQSRWYVLPVGAPSAFSSGMFWEATCCSTKALMLGHLLSFVLVSTALPLVPWASAPSSSWILIVVALCTTFSTSAPTRWITD